MNKLCICDLDGVIADSTERFKRAEEAKQAYLASYEKLRGGLDIDKNATATYWKTAFSPELVALDTLIDGADECIHQLELDDYRVVYLTSRPEQMRTATYDWLLKHRLSGPRLVMKPPAAQYVKTVLWKAITVQMLVSLYCADEVLVVDDEPANLDKLQEYDTSFMRLCSSLAEAIMTPADASDSPF